MTENNMSDVDFWYSDLRSRREPKTKAQIQNVCASLVSYTRRNSISDRELLLCMNHVIENIGEVKIKKCVSKYVWFDFIVGSIAFRRADILRDIPNFMWECALSPQYASAVILRISDGRRWAWEYVPEWCKEKIPKSSHRLCMSIDPAFSKYVDITKYSMSDAFWFVKNHPFLVKGLYHLTDTKIPYDMWEWLIRKGIVVDYLPDGFEKDMVIMKLQGKMAWRSYS